MTLNPFKLYKIICGRFPWFHNLVLYAVFGLLAAVLDYSIFFVLSRFIGICPEIASLAGNICGFFFTFSGNTFYNFKKSSHLLFRFVSYLCIAAGGMTLSTLLIHNIKDLVNVYLLKAVLVLFVIPVIQFILNKTITYRDFHDPEITVVGMGKHHCTAANRTTGKCPHDRRSQPQRLQYKEFTPYCKKLRMICFGVCNSVKKSLYYKAETENICLGGLGDCPVFYLNENELKSKCRERN